MIVYIMMLIICVKLHSYNPHRKGTIYIGHKQFFFQIYQGQVTHVLMNWKGQSDSSKSLYVTFDVKSNTKNE